VEAHLSVNFNFGSSVIDNNNQKWSTVKNLTVVVLKSCEPLNLRYKIFRQRSIEVIFVIDGTARLKKCPQESRSPSCTLFVESTIKQIGMVNQKMFLRDVRYRVEFV
jgi:hypothetical protein